MERVVGYQTTLDSNDTSGKLSLLTSCVANLSQRVDQLQDEVTQLKQEMNSSRKYSYKSDGAPTRDESSDMTSNVKNLRNLSNSDVSSILLTESKIKGKKRLREG